MTEKELEVRLSLSGKHKKMFDELLQEEREKAIDECISILEKFTKGTTRESFNWVEIWHNLWVAFKQLKGKE